MSAKPQALVRSDAFATVSGPAATRCQRSQRSQQHHPAMTRIPCRSASVEEFVALDLALKANGVQVHVQNIMELRLQPLRVSRSSMSEPSRRRGSELFAINPKQPGAFFRHLRGDLANSNLRML